MTATFSIPYLHNEYAYLIKELNFYKEEIEYHSKLINNTFEKRLLGNESIDLAKNLLKRFKLFNSEIIKLESELNRSEKKLVAYVYESSGLGLDNIKMDNHQSLRFEIADFKKMLIVLKNDYRNLENKIKNS